MNLNHNIIVAGQAALISTGFISFIPNIVFLFLPNYQINEGISSSYLSYGQAMAAGSLLGDVFLHTIPDVTNTIPNYGLYIIGGYFLFMIADIIIRTVHELADNNDDDQNSKGTVIANKKQGGDHNHVHSTSTNRSTIVLNLVADSLHNFTDGLAIGVSYSVLAMKNTSNTTPTTLLSLLRVSRGSLATLAILLHEIPHELGDFCTLVKSGYSKKQAIIAQFITSIAAFTGTIFAFILQQYIIITTTTNHNNNNNNQIQEILLLLTAGGFIYLAATTILPEVLNNTIPTNNNNDTKKISQRYDIIRFRLLQLMSFVVGVSFLYAVAMLEEEDGHHHGHSHHDHEHHHEDRHLESLDESVSSKQHHDHHHHHEHDDL